MYQVVEGHGLNLGEEGQVVQLQRPEREEAVEGVVWNPIQIRLAQIQEGQSGADRANQGGGDLKWKPYFIFILFFF